MTASIALYFQDVPYEQLYELLDSVGKRYPDTAWSYPKDNGYVSVYPYDDLLDEFESDQLNELLTHFNDLPTSILCIEFKASYGSKTCEAAAELAEMLLMTFPGVVDDLYDQFWTSEEIRTSAKKGTGSFAHSVQYPASVEEWDAKIGEVRSKRQREFS